MDPKHLCGGLTGRFLQHWKSQSLARVSENCVFLGSKNYPKPVWFFEKNRFTTVLELFVGQLHFLPSHLRVLFQLLGSCSQHAVPAVLCWSLLIVLVGNVKCRESPTFPQLPSICPLPCSPAAHHRSVFFFLPRFVQSRVLFASVGMLEVCPAIHF